MKFSNTLALSLIGVLLFGLCLVAGIGLHDDKLSLLALVAMCFLMGAFVAFWFAGEGDYDND
jgi:hypothetical protein